MKNKFEDLKLYEEDSTKVERKLKKIAKITQNDAQLKNTRFVYSPYVINQALNYDTPFEWIKEQTGNDFEHLSDLTWDDFDVTNGEDQDKIVEMLYGSECIGFDTIEDMDLYIGYIEDLIALSK